MKLTNGLEILRIDLNSENYPNFKEGIKAHKEFEMLKKQNFDIVTSKPILHVLNEIVLNIGNIPCLCVVYAFNYGYIQGKRAERKRHKVTE